MRPKRFSIEPYKDVLYLFCPCSKEEAESWLARNGLEEHVDMGEYDEEDAVTYDTDAGNFVFMHKFDDSPTDIGVLVHELCHVTFNVLNGRGVKEEPGSEEAAAYLLDHLVEKCIKHLRGRRRSPKVRAG